VPSSSPLGIAGHAHAAAPNCCAAGEPPRGLRPASHAHASSCAAPCVGPAGFEAVGKEILVNRRHERPGRTGERWTKKRRLRIATAAGPIVVPVPADASVADACAAVEARLRGSGQLGKRRIRTLLLPELGELSYKAAARQQAPARLAIGAVRPRRRGLPR
jgi:hypothetical protein